MRVARLIYWRFAPILVVPQAGQNDGTETYESLETPLNIFTFDDDNKT